VKLIVPFAPGGTADVFGRIAADILSKAFNQQFIVENRAGGGGLVGSASVAAAPADGYTLLVSGMPTLVVAPATTNKPPYDPLQAFTHIAYLGGVPLVLISGPSLRATTYQEFMTVAQRHEDTLSYASPGTGTHAHLFGEYLARRERIRLAHVPYKGASPAMTDIIAGHVPLGVMSLSASIEQIRTRKVSALAVSSSDRIREFPLMPTFRELGFGDLTAATWFSLSGPAKLPSEITTSINRAILAGMQSPELTKRLAQEVIEIRLLSPETFKDFIGIEIARWHPMVREITKQNQ
jgi:tripartite-type tricarboxylate transporter receptor subunit TctC